MLLFEWHKVSPTENMAEIFMLLNILMNIVRYLYIYEKISVYINL